MPNRTNIIIYFINTLISSHIGRLLAGNRKAWAETGQVFVEYALIAVLVVTALVAIKLYLERGLQARYKGATDYAIRALTTARNIYTQYEPYYQDTDFTTWSESTTRSGHTRGRTSKEIGEGRLRKGDQTTPPYQE